MSGTERDLSSIAEAVADGDAVDWEREARSHAELDSQLRGLRTVQSIAEFQRAATLETPGPEESRVSEKAAREETLPRRWGDLEVIERLGEGGFAEVFRAYDSTLQREVALKLPHTRDEFLSGTFLNEARRLARIHHENVLAVHGAEKHDGRVGIWADLLEGRTLEECLEEQGPFGASETALIGIALCRALAAVHGAGLVHRDIKTSNVMREEGGRIVLMDFSSVVEGARGHRPADDDASTYGSPYYMAPELLAGEEATVSSDIYALGVLLYRLASGRYPVEGDSLTELAEKHRKGGAVPLLDVRPDLPAPFAQVIEGALADSPDKRYATAGEMERALSTAVTSAPLDVPRASRPILSHRALWAGLGVVVLLVLAILLAQRYLGAGPLSIEASLFRRGVQTDERLNPGATLAPGQQLFLEIQGSRSFHAYVLNEDAKGEKWVLFPLPERLELVNPLPGDTQHRLPGMAAVPDEGELVRVEKFWEVTSTGGEETLLLIASVGPLEELEAAIASFPRAGTVDAVPLPQEQLESSLRGIGGLTSGSGEERWTPSTSLSGLSQRLVANRSDEVQIWGIRLLNPRDSGGSSP